ncbi:MAG: D-arabinono-1,4-lactone oxidase, partial [Lysinibacillus sp.]
MFSVKGFKKGKWTNWSESYTAYPGEVHLPESIDEACDIVKRHAKEKRTIRVTGAAHSFSPVAMPEQSALSLHRLRGLIAVDKEQLTATFYAGTYLHEVGPLLEEHGLALINMGDIQEQSLAGAISTGTHGTGVMLGSFSSMVTQWGFVNGLGEYIEHERTNDDLSEALHVSLGLLGILVKVTIKVIPIYSLEYTSERKDFHDELSNFQTTIRENRHAEWFYFPGSTQIQLKKMNIVAPQRQSQAQKRRDELKVQLLENNAFSLASKLVKVQPRLGLAVSKLSSKLIGEADRTGISYEIYPSPRAVKFVETEYAIPLRYFEDSLAEIHAMFERGKFNVHFPIECRTTAGESGFLSPTQGEESAFLAFHMYKGMDESAYFDWVHKTMERYGGRPHWGKVNR